MKYEYILGALLRKLKEVRDPVLVTLGQCAVIAENLSVKQAEFEASTMALALLLIG